VKQPLLFSVYPLEIESGGIPLIHDDPAGELTVTSRCSFSTVVVAALSLAAACIFAAPHARAESLDIAVHHVGLSFGNSKRFTGLRFNFVDERVERINGVNVTFWKPGKSPGGTVNGLSLALVGTGIATMNGLNLAVVGASADRIAGVSVGLIGVAAEERATGISVGGIGLGGGRFTGIMVGGIGIGADAIKGIGVALIGIGADDVDGAVLGLIGVGADTLRGFGFGGIGIGGDKLHGVFIGGIGVGGNEVKGLAVGGIGVGGDKLTGCFIGGVGCGADGLTGVGIGGLGIGANDVRGVALSPIFFQATDAKWFTAASFNRVRRDMVGLQIGVVNISSELRGVQLGALNWAGNNPAWARILPLVNVHL
jgi:hypothetical protein